MEIDGSNGRWCACISLRAAAIVASPGAANHEGPLSQRSICTVSMVATEAAGWTDLGRWMFRTLERRSGDV
jgi:hypothetical protein